MPDQPETPGQRMGRIIREQPPMSDRRRLLDNLRRTWNQKKENHDA
jgi:hypothetical protein